jgi:hypothetical protein
MNSPAKTAAAKTISIIGHPGGGLLVARDVVASHGSGSVVGRGPRHGLRIGFLADFMGMTWKIINE